MKKFVIFIIGCLLVQASFSQDIIYKIDGTEIKSFVLEITSSTIKYKNFTQPDGPIRNILLKDVFMIIYKDGTKEVFKGKSIVTNQQSIAQTQSNSSKDVQQYQVDQKHEDSNIANEGGKTSETNPPIVKNTANKVSEEKNKKNIIYGKEGFHINLGVSVNGPRISLVDVFPSDAGELYFNYHAFVWDRNENNRITYTSGGFNVGFNFYLNYATHSRFKWCLGLTEVLYNERVGKNSIYQNYDWKGYTSLSTICTGVRFFISKNIHIDAQTGYVVYIDDSQSIAQKYRNIIGPTKVTYGRYYINFYILFTI